MELVRAATYKPVIRPRRSDILAGNSGHLNPCIPLSNTGCHAWCHLFEALRTLSTTVCDGIKGSWSMRSMTLSLDTLRVTLTWRDSLVRPGSELGSPQSIRSMSFTDTLTNAILPRRANSDSCGSPAL